MNPEKNKCERERGGSGRRKKMEKASWNSQILESAYSVCGWLAFFFWSSCLYPQLFLNFRRKSVVGLNFNYALMNNTKHTVYFIYNACLYFSPDVQFQYHTKYGFRQMIPVAANDVAVSFHSVMLTLLTLFQIAIYDRGNQTLSKFTILMVCVVWLIIIACYFVALPAHSWLWFLSILTSLQVCMTSIKYIPQAVMNYLRKSTDGFSIGYVLLDFSGGTLNYAQMIMQSLDQNSWVNLFGNIGKLLLSMVSMFFTLLFMCQHYLLYATKKAPISSKMDGQVTEPLVAPLLGEEVTRATKSSIQNA